MNLNIILLDDILKTIKVMSKIKGESKWKEKIAK